ncbi:MAG: HigA family addiction module antidote protein [Gammaproteobacteria bacterium]|nr:HigA family addiction module antidote protein [Gammaproteobacteria bacterium]
MTITRQDVDQHSVDFRGVTSGRRLPAIHPGEILRDEFLRPMNITVYRLAKALNVSRPRLNDIVLARRAVTTDTALRLGRYFGTTPEFWINLQTRYDLDVAERTTRRRIEREVRPHAA